LPIVKTKKALADMASGQVLRVVATDPGSVADMAAFAEQTGNRLLEQTIENKKHVFFLKKA
jgi:tRNA 2-thiouridine synthesizing protein A